MLCVRLTEGKGKMPLTRSYFFGDYCVGLSRRGRFQYVKIERAEKGVKLSRARFCGCWVFMTKATDRNTPVAALQDIATVAFGLEDRPKRDFRLHERRID